MTSQGHLRCTVMFLTLALGACVHRFSTTMDAWVGKDQAALISSLGAPDRTAELADGSKVLTWITPWNTADDGAPPVMQECRRSFTIATNGTVRSWSATGCPKVYLKG